MIHPPTEPRRDPAPLVPGLPGDPRRWLIEVAQVVVIAALLYAVVTGFVAQPYRVELGSMEPALLPQDHLLVDRLSPRWDAFERGDIVIFDPPPPHDANGIAYVKRVIGVAGDTVRIEAGRIRVTPADGSSVTLAESDSVGPTLPQDAADTTSWQVPGGAVFVLGDNRGQSIDSRTFGPVATDRVIGRAWLRYLPLTRIEILDSGD